MNPGGQAQRIGHICTPDRRISSFVTTSIAPAAVHPRSSFRDTVDTSKVISSSSDIFFKLVTADDIDDVDWALATEG